MRPETPGWQETEGKGSTRSGGCGGGLGDRGGATPRGVQLVESEGRRSESELGCGVPGAGRRRSRPSLSGSEQRSWARE